MNAALTAEPASSRRTSVSRRGLNRALETREISARLECIDWALPRLRDRLDPCTLCPRECGARRLTGETGECGLDGQLRVASIARHKGEEPPISGKTGAINVFFSGCNLHCLHCQNWPISQHRVGRTYTIEGLADAILRKWHGGAQALGWVTPTPQIVPALEVYRRCLWEGLNLPLVHNGGGYDSVEILRVLEGIVDIWLPDAKMSDSMRSREINGVDDYPERNLGAIEEMVNQMKAGHARAVIVRHLVLPDALDDSRETLQRLWNYFGNRIHLSLMTQYFPTYQTENHPALGRRLKPEEYEEIVAYARRLGFKRGWVQTLEEEVGIPLYCLQ